MEGVAHELVEKGLCEVIDAAHSALVEWGPHADFSADASAHLHRMEERYKSLPEQVATKSRPHICLVARVTEVLRFLEACPSAKMIQAARGWVQKEDETLLDGEGRAEASAGRFATLVEECTRIKATSSPASADKADLGQIIAAVLKVAVGISQRLKAEKLNELQDLMKATNPEKNVSARSPSKPSNAEEAMAHCQTRPTHRINSKRAFSEVSTTAGQAKMGGDRSLMVGRPAMIGELPGDPLNNQACRLVRFEPQASRWMVELIDGRLRPVKIQNLSCSMATDAEFWQLKASASASSAPVDEGERRPPEEVGRSRRVTPEFMMPLKKAAKGGTPGQVVRTSAVQAPEKIEYSGYRRCFAPGSRVNMVPATIGGDATSFTVVPTLPDGLSIDPKTGEIKGVLRPFAETEEKTYMVSGRNAAGETMVGLTFSVKETLGDLFHQDHVVARKVEHRSAPVAHEAPPTSSVPTAAAPPASSRDNIFSGPVKAERRPWTEEEERRLLDGHTRYGNAWETIRDFCNLRHRTGVQLKDKMRNLRKYPQIVADLN